MLLEKCRHPAGATTYLSARRYTCRARSRKRRFAAWRRTCGTTRKLLLMVPERALALPDCLPASGLAQNKTTMSPAVFPGQRFRALGSSRGRFAGRYEQVLLHNITNLFKDWFHSRTTIHAVGISVFGWNVDAEVKNRGVVLCIPEQIVS